MSAALRFAALAAFLSGLSGCNVVVSEDPWFTGADAAPTPVLRDGLWLSAEPDCRVDETRPAERWPDCADATFVRGEERWSMRWDRTDSRSRGRRNFAGWESGDDPTGDGLLVANGDHLILQFQAENEPNAPPSDTADEGAGKTEPRGYMYGVMRPVRFDNAGQVEAYETWVVQCGPLPEPVRTGRTEEGDSVESTPHVTDRPFPGLTVVDDNCIAESVEALRRAAVLSEALGNKDEFRWVREGWR